MGKGEEVTDTIKKWEGFPTLKEPTQLEEPTRHLPTSKEWMGGEVVESSSYTPGPGPGATSFLPTYKLCSHRPMLVLAGVYNHRRWQVYAASQSRAEGAAWEYDLVINCTGHGIAGGRKNTIPPRMGMKKWVHPLASRELVIDWPDFHPPISPSSSGAICSGS